MGRDFNDVLREADGDFSVIALERYMQDAPLPEPDGPNGQDVGIDHYSEAVGLPVVRVSDWLGQTPPDRRWIVPGLIPACTVTLFAGHGGIGKRLIWH